MPSAPVSGPAVGGMKLTFIMTGLCLAVLLTGMVRFMIPRLSFD